MMEIISRNICQFIIYEEGRENKVLFDKESQKICYIITIFEKDLRFL